ncbi:hypothetical protein TNCT_12971, partial [Trichonephila clavata]
MAEIVSLSASKAAELSAIVLSTRMVIDALCLRLVRKNGSTLR